MKRKLFSLFITALMSASMWATEGALLGRFTINANGDQIVFSKGNLQYKNGTGWRFAEHQWDFVGAWDTNDWVDLFGWGTWGEGKNPLNTSTTDGDYSWSTDFSGTLTNATSEGWYTPSTDIFEYILNTRSTNSGIRYSKARVNGIDGLILLPDDWNSSIYTLINANIYYAWYESTIISLTDWTNQLEANGAVFIPRASLRGGASAGPGGDGHYWTTTPGYALHFTNSDLSSSYGYCYKYYGFAVRLVRAADPEEPYVLQQDGEGNYLLGNLLDWKAFAELVQTNPTANAKMTADINLGNDQTMIGSLSVPYAGIFDGQGHTLTVAYNQSDIKQGIGPFYVLGAATIQNLHVDGSMLTRCGIGGIAGIVKGNATIQRCWVSATLQSNGYSPRGTIGGICSVLEGVDDAHLIIEDCLFDGTIVDNEFCGGFMSHVERASCSVTMRRGLNIGTYPTTTNENGTFIREVLSGVRNLEASTLFHKKVFGKAQGTQVTDEQLADGTIATALQAGRAEEIWVQDGATPMLKLFVTPIEAITANEDPDHAGIYYSTFFDGSVKYELPVGVEAYVATLSNDNLVLTKIAEGGQVMPANTAVILKSDAASIMLTPSTADAVTFTATNSLQGTDVATAAPANCYVLSGHSADNSEIGVGFYQYTGTLKAHRAYVTISNPNSAPKRLRFVFDSATAIENTDADVKAEKRIENGVLYIIKNGVKYNAQGQTVK